MRGLTLRGVPQITRAGARTAFTITNGAAMSKLIAANCVLGGILTSLWGYEAALAGSTWFAALYSAASIACFAAGYVVLRADAP